MFSDTGIENLTYPISTQNFRRKPIHLPTIVGSDSTAQFASAERLVKTIMLPTLQYAYIHNR